MCVFFLLALRPYFSDVFVVDKFLHQQNGSYLGFITAPISANFGIMGL